MDLSDHLGWIFFILLIVGGILSAAPWDRPAEDNDYICTETYSLNTGPTCY